MALLKFGGGITEIRGSMAGNVYSRNRYGAYMRARTVPVNPNTARQDVVRSAMSFLTDRWAHTLTNLQRIAWNDYGAAVPMLNKLGESIRLSGFNHYIRSNVIAKMISLTIVDDGPVDHTLAEQDPLFAVTASEATGQITAAYDATLGWANETGANLILFGGFPQNAQRNFFGGPWRLYGQVAGVDGAPPASPHLGSSAYGIAELQRLWCYARVRRVDGRLSEPFRDDTFIAA